jgi:predicted Zn finger-like uncharacterized protein
MFTVCPKCALTLVVTAADLRVAQGYVRCGRCSNVFNALARLSEDRQAAAAAAQAQSSPDPKPAPTSQQRPDTSVSSRTRLIPESSSTSKTRQSPDLSGSAKFRLPADASAPATRKAAQPPAPPGQDARASHAMHPPPPPPSEPKRYDDNSIAEEDLEFNPDATDLNKVFVEQPPSPKFTAATGTFKAIRLEAEDSARAEEQLAQTDGRETRDRGPFDPVDTQVDVEIDPDLLATMAQLTSNRLERLDPTPPGPEPDLSSALFGEPPPISSKAPGNSTASTGALKALAPPKAPGPAKQSMLLQPPMEQPPQPPAPMRLAERAKARAAASHAQGHPAQAAQTGPDTARPDAGLKADAVKSDTRPKSDAALKSDAKRASALETAQAIRAALVRKSRPTANEQPTSFLAGTWAAGSALLILMLAIQVVHHYRHDLAANATLNGPLTSIYAALGIPIVPRWDLGAYEVRQLGASTTADAPGEITVRASVKNDAHQAQPLPLLRVTLQDRFGNRIASRDVPPQSYLPRAIPPSSLLSAGQRIDAEMAFVDPGSNAVGFEIDACLPAPGGGISCANDTAR